MNNSIKKLVETTQDLADAYKQMYRMNLYCDTLLEENKRLEASLNKYKENNTTSIYITSETFEYLKDWLYFIETREKEEGRDLTYIHDVMAFIENITNSNAVEIIDEDEDEEGFTY